MSTRIFSIVVGLALIFSACNKDAQEGAGVKAGNGIQIGVDEVLALVEDHDGCITWFGVDGKVEPKNEGMKAEYNSMPNQVNGSGADKNPVGKGIKFVKNGNDTDLIIEPDAEEGTLVIGYKKGNYYELLRFEIACLKELGFNSIYFSGKKYSNLRWYWEKAEDKTEIEVDLGFIGFYLKDGNVLSTSFYWQKLKKGDCIDWAAVYAAYEKWFADGGLELDTENGWHTSGYAPLNFVNDEKICHEAFSFDQLEGYYRSYYVSAGYKLPACEQCDCEAKEGWEWKDGECVEIIVTPPTFELKVDCDGFVCAQGGDNIKQLSFDIVKEWSDGRKEIIYVYNNDRYKFEGDGFKIIDKNDSINAFKFDGVIYYVCVKIKSNSLSCSDITWQTTKPKSEDD